MSGGITIPNFDHWPHVLPDASETSDGLMSAADKLKLDGLVPGAGFTYTGFQAFTSIGPNAITVTLPAPMAGSPYNVILCPRIDDDAQFINYYYKVLNAMQFTIILSTPINGGVTWGVFP